MYVPSQILFRHAQLSAHTMLIGLSAMQPGSPGCHGLQQRQHFAGVAVGSVSVMVSILARYCTSCVGSHVTFDCESRTLAIPSHSLPSEYVARQETV